MVSQAREVPVSQAGEDSREDWVITDQGGPGYHRSGRTAVSQAAGRSRYHRPGRAQAREVGGITGQGGPGITGQGGRWYDGGMTMRRDSNASHCLMKAAPGGGER